MVAYRVLTVSREFGSGGGRIAGMVAGWLGWKLLEGALIEAIAREGKVDANIVSQLDEHAESWLSRFNRKAMRGAALGSGVVAEDQNYFDPDVMTDLTRQIVTQAHAEGGCVIVGRGAQCILQYKPDVFHVYVYAPFCERVERLKKRLEPGVNIEQRIRSADAERAQYLHQRFGIAWHNPHLYDLMISSCEDEEATARVVLYSMTGVVREVSPAAG